MDTVIAESYAKHNRPLQIDVSVFAIVTTLPKLVHHPITLTLCVKFDQGIKQLIRDTKGFQRAGFLIDVKRVFEVEDRLNLYHITLKESVDRV